MRRYLVTLNEDYNQMTAHLFIEGQRDMLAIEFTKSMKKYTKKMEFVTPMPGITVKDVTGTM